MNQIIRNGLNIRNVFESENLKKVYQDNQTEKDGLITGVNIYKNTNSDKCNHKFNPLKGVGNMKQFIKKTLKPLCNMIEIFISKARKCITDSLRNEILSSVAETKKEILNSNTETKNTISDELLRLKEEIVNENRRNIEISIDENTKSTNLLLSSVEKEFQTFLYQLSQRLDLIEKYALISAKRVFINGEIGESLIRTEVGYVVCSSSDYPLLSCLIEAGELEKGTRILIEKILKPGNVFVDIGANIGMHTLAAAKAMKGKGKIFAFEPYYSTARMLKKSLIINGISEITEIHNVAIANKKCEGKLYLGPTCGHHSIYEFSESPGNLYESVDIQIVKLTDVIQSNQHIDLMKIDVEGAEIEVIKSAVPLISNNREILIIVEYGPVHLKRTGISPDEWFRVFSDLGLSYFVINEQNGKLEKSSVNELNCSESTNLLFLFQGSKSWNLITKKMVL